SNLLLGVFPEKSMTFWLGIILMITIFSFVIGGLSAIFTSVMLRMKNVNAAHGLFTILIMSMAAIGGHFFPMEQLPSWMQALSEWTPTGITVSVFTDMLQNGDGAALTIPFMKQAGFFFSSLLIGILFFP